MCGRFALYTPAARIAEIFEVVEPLDVAARWNVPPTDPIVAVMIARDGQRRMGMVRWGLQPFFLKDKKGPPLINARAETLVSKPMFRSAFSDRRCLVPADGFYEWERVGKERRGWFIGRKDREPFAMAALYETVKDEAGERHGSAAIITCEANELVAPIHDRMPVILPRSEWAAWLDRSDHDVEYWLSKLKPLPSADLIRYRVGPAVNSVKNDIPECAAEAS
jgi:putative SOS response-associated peptidase YedK